MRLHHPVHLAQRSANPLLLSVTCDDLPRRVAYYRYQVADDHWLIVVRRGITYGAISHAYARAGLPAWARERIFGSLGVADPVENVDLYHRTRWWGEDWETSHVSAELLEHAGPGLITPWPHAWLLNPPA